MSASENQIVVYQPNETARLTQEASSQCLFCQGRYWNVKSLLNKFIRRAKKELIVIDAYVGVATLDMLIKCGRAGG